MVTTKKAVTPKQNKVYINFNYYDGWVEDIETDSKADGNFDYSIEVILPAAKTNTPRIIGSVKVA